MLQSISGRVLGRRGEARRGKARRWRGVASQSQLASSFDPPRLWAALSQLEQRQQPDPTHDARRRSFPCDSVWRIAPCPPAIQPARPSARDNGLFFPCPGIRARAASGAALAALQLARPPSGHRAASSPPLPLGPPRNCSLELTIALLTSSSSSSPLLLLCTFAPPPFGLLSLARPRLHLR